MEQDRSGEHTPRRYTGPNAQLQTIHPEHEVIRCSEWVRRTNKTHHRTSVNLDESLARGHNSPWTTWRCLNRLHIDGRRYVCCNECNVVSNECNEPTSVLGQHIDKHGGELGYLGVYALGVSLVS